MKKKKIIILFVFIVISIIAIYGMYSKNKNKSIKTPNVKSNLAIMVKENGATNYTSASSVPKGDYIINEDKSVCENGGKVFSYDSEKGQIKFSLLGSDRCTLYFDYYEDIAPVISNVTVKGKNLSASFSDDISLCCYAIISDNSTPSEWIDIEGSSYTLNTTIANEGTYYLWLKDSKGNIVSHGNIVIERDKYGYETILINNNGATIIEGKGDPDFSKVATQNEGMYSAKDDLGTSYYFRGAVDNNWVKFGKDNGKDIYWRIIRINGDNTIRTIYSGTTAPTSGTATVMTGTGTQISTSAFNESIDNLAYVGYMYKLNTQYGSETSSTIKQTIDGWYAKTTLVNTDSSKIADQVFCSDRRASADENGYPQDLNSTTSTHYYGAYIRNNTKKSPSLYCTNVKNKFSVNASNGNGALIYPVGLITADEVAMAGGVNQISNNAYYLYTNQYYWVGSPNQFNHSYHGDYASEISIYSSGIMGASSVNNDYGIRPVISLASTIKLSGNGTYNNPYVVK